MTTWTYNDGGREAAGYKGETQDCVTRAIAIATEQPYACVYKDLRDLGADPRNGVHREIWQPYIESLGWKWVPTMKIGSGCKVHLKASELPSGRIIARTSKHMVAVIDGMIHDTFDPSRGGTRCVYGYFMKVG